MGAASPSRATAPPPASKPDTGGFLRAALRERPFAVSAVAALAVTLGSVAAFTPRFETNDDVAMTMIASGVGFTDRPDEHILYSSILLGVALKGLYVAAPSVPWYGLYQFAALAAAAAGIAYALLRVNPSPRQAAAVLLFLGVAIVPCLVSVQFTKTSFLVSLAGLLLFLAPLRGAPPSRAADAGAVALVILGTFIRFQSYLLAGALLLPVAVAALVADPWATLRRGVPVVAVTVVAAGVYLAGFSYYNRDPAWKDSFALGNARVEFTDYDRFRYTEQTRPAFEAVGWDALDLDMIRNWYYADRRLYSVDNLRRLAATVPPAPRPPLADPVAAVRGVLADPGLFRLILALPCAVALAGGVRRLALPATLFATSAGLTLALNYFFWLPNRVAFPLLAGVVAGAVLRPPDPNPPRAGTAGYVLDRLALVAAGIGAVALVAASLAAAEETSDQFRRKREDALKMIQALKPRPDQLYVVWREWFPFEALVTPLGDPSPLRPLRCVGLSSLQDTPFFERRLEQFGVTDLCLAICERPDVRLVAIPPMVENLFRPYVRRHYLRDPALRLCFARPDSRPPVFVFQADRQHGTPATPPARPLP